MILSIGGTYVYIQFFSGNSASSLQTTATGPVVQKYRDKAVVHLYFGAMDGKYLTAEERVLPRPDDASVHGAIIMDALASGPERELLKTLPDDAAALSVFVTDSGTAFVNMNSQTSQNHPGGIEAEFLTVYSIVNTLVLNVSGIERIKILINGREAETLAGHLDIEQPFEADMLLVR